MTRQLYLLRAGNSRRLSALLSFCLAEHSVRQAGLNEMAGGLLKGQALVFALSVDEWGMTPETLALIRCLRSNGQCLAGATGCVLVDGVGELYTKQTAQSVILAANLAGCSFPGKPLIEGTGSLYNQHIMAANLGFSLEGTYFHRSRELIQRLEDFTPPRFARPKLLMLHASESKRSNTLALGSRVLELLGDRCDTSVMSLQNGAIYDCRGCSYTACLHYSRNGTCYYGGALPTAVFPAILESNVVLLLCPNYNDAVSANISALINRMTSLVVRQALYDKYLYAVVVSGYSGGDLVARQVLGALCLNKTMMLPPNFCFFQTANDPGSALSASGIHQRLEQWADVIRNQICL